MKKNKTTRQKLQTALVILGVLLVILIGAAVYLHTMTQGEQNETPATDAQGGATQSVDSSSGETVSSTVAPEVETDPIVYEDVLISTELCDLYYPGQWEDQIRAEYTAGDIGGSVTFYGTANNTEVKLFIIYFGKGSDDSFSVGALKVGGLSLSVSLELCEFELDDTWSAEDVDSIHAMQEGSNHVMDRLRENPDFSKVVSTNNGSTGNSNTGSTGNSNTGSTGNSNTGSTGNSNTGSTGNSNTGSTGNSNTGGDNSDASEPAEETTAPAEDLKITTPYADLYFPAEWADQVRTEEVPVDFGYVLKFYGSVGDKEEWLFTIFFADASENSFPVGLITADDMTIDVSIELADFVPDDSWSVDEADAISAMQEAANYITEKLKENPNFEAA